MSAASSPLDWAGRCTQQAESCAELGSPLYGRLLSLLATEVAQTGPTWEVIAPRAELRFGQAGPLRLLGAAHRLALRGAAPSWALMLPSCGGEVPTTNGELISGWSELVRTHGQELSEGLDCEVQTNEVARAAGLALGLASTAFSSARLVELGCSAGLNLRLDQFCIELASRADSLGVGSSSKLLGDPRSTVRISPELRTAAPNPLGQLPRITERIGIDPHPLDATTEQGELRLLGFVWPDQLQRIERCKAAIEMARRVPAVLMQSALMQSADSASEGEGKTEHLAARPPSALPDTAELLESLLADDQPTVVQQSIVWQYIPPELRWRITAVIEAAGRRATPDAPLAWVRFEPDEWDRRRAAVWLRTWPTGSDCLVAHVDYHGRWIAPRQAISTR